MKLKHNKAFKRDSCRVAFLVCGDFCGESGVRKLGLCGIHPLTRRYVYRGYLRNYGVNLD
ncbi:DUF3265 domain-containing protein [Vibrio parahaemolyticus]|nr:DUF3265 domain-containing protein [Vibrio parahaemolyticus]EJT3518313.1 DUF3265 domain-containing protein [Vibrio parahaemolyticus]